MISQLEKDLARKKIVFAGVDEAGRGPLAGPVVAAAVIWDYNYDPLDIKDSKLLPKARRQELFDYIIAGATSVAVGWSSQIEIDRINILNAALLSMARAIAKLKPKPRMLLVDGNREVPSISIPQEAIIGGDGKHVAISAAGIVAKVARDMLMAYFDTVYPGYGFSHNAGYATLEHRTAIREFGPCPLHRKTFHGVLDATIRPDLFDEKT